MLDLVLLFAVVLLVYWVAVASRHHKDFPPGPR